MRVVVLRRIPSLSVYYGAADDKIARAVVQLDEIFRSMETEEAK